MNKHIIYTQDNGQVALCTPTGEISIEEVLAKDCPPHAFIVDEVDLPIFDNDFFDCWELMDNKVVVNLNKAKEQTKDRLRAERAPLLQAQDIAFQKALEQGGDTSAVVAEKNRLRDITKLADTATTLDELRAIKVEVTHE